MFLFVMFQLCYYVCVNLHLSCHYHFYRIDWNNKIVKQQISGKMIKLMSTFYVVILQ
jgi:hypothetical protein